VKQFELENIVFRRNVRFTLEIDELILDQGEKVAVVGPNGSGKTTLLRLLCFLEQPDSWQRFCFRGQPYVPRKMDRKRLGFLKQQHLVFSGSVAQNLAYPLKLQRLSIAEIERRTHAMLTLMQLDHLQDASAGKLSGGEQRRLALGRVLISAPQTILLDEPVAHLDARSRAVIEGVLTRADATILLTTHDVHFAHRVASRVLSLKAGRLSEGLSVNVIEGHFEEGCLLTAHGLRVVLPETTVPTRYGSLAAMIDPRCLKVTLEPPVSDAQSLLRGHVSSIREQGDDVWLEIDCGDRLIAIVNRAAYEKESLNLHREVVVSFDADAVEML